jgi:DNA-binding transcriptional MerR regulator
MNDMFIKNISEKVMSLDEIREYIDAHDQGWQMPAWNAKKW